MGRKILGTLLALLGVSAAIFYLYYTPGSVTLSVMDPPPQPYDPSIQAIYVTLNKVEVHIANAGNNTGWYTVASNATINLVTVLDASKVLGNAKLPQGKYTELRFFTSEAIITITGTNVTYSIPSGNQTGIKIVILGGGFHIFGGQSLTLQLDLAFNNTEIMNNPTRRLTPIATAKVV